jgi:hypothetical protein
LNTLDEFLSAVKKHIKDFEFGECEDFGNFEILRTHRDELAIRCSMVHYSKVELTIEFTNVWNIQFHSTGGRMGIVEPFITRSHASNARQEYFEYWDEQTKTHWSFESMRLISIR